MENRNKCYALARFEIFCDGSSEGDAPEIRYKLAIKPIRQKAASSLPLRGNHRLASERVVDCDWQCPEFFARLFFVGKLVEITDSLLVA
jgi:hypothetical protein